MVNVGYVFAAAAVTVVAVIVAAAVTVVDVVDVDVVVVVIIEMLNVELVPVAAVAFHCVFETMMICPYWIAQVAEDGWAIPTRSAKSNRQDRKYGRRCTVNTHH